MSAEIDTALYAYNEAESARRCATRLANAARDELLHALGQPLRSCTLSPLDEGAPRLKKQDVDTVGVLSPSQRRRMRLLRMTLRG